VDWHCRRDDLLANNFPHCGIAPKNSQWIAGINTVTYMFSTLICVFTLDRRWTLYWDSVGQGVTPFLAGGLVILSKNSEGTKATQAGNAAVAMVFLFTMIFGATWLTVPW